MVQMPDSTIMTFEGKTPQLGENTLVCSGVRLIGDVEIGDETNIWFNTVIRGDVHFVRIGQRTNIQDNSTIHVTANEASCEIGNDVTVGHAAVVHACRVEDTCLVGMGATILDRAVIGKESLVAAGALVTQGKEFPPRSLIMGSPAKVVRTLTDEEVQGLRESATHYVELARKYM